VPIVSTTASTGDGVDDLRTAIDDHHAAIGGDDRLAERRRRRARMQVSQIALGAFRDRAAAVTGAAGLDELAGRVAERALDPYTAADRLLAALPTD
jgi:LAO/AO transport system kinase